MMGSYTVLILFAFLVEGVFADADDVKSVMEGDLVALNTSVTKKHHDMVRWYFNDIRIAQINGDPSTSCLYDGEDGRFRDRLKVDYETGSLTITHIRSEHTGRYEAELIRKDSSGKSESLNRISKCDSTKIIPQSSNLDEIIKSISLTVSDEVKSVMEEDPVILNPGVTKEPDVVWWYFNSILIAMIDGKICLYDGEDGRFRDRLEVDHETRSLTITNIRSEHTGHYEAVLTNSSGKNERLNRASSCDPTQIIPRSSNSDKSMKSISLTVSASKADKKEKGPQKAPLDQNIDATVPGSGLPPAAVAGIVGVGVVLVLVAAAVVGVMIYRRMRYRNDKKKNKQGVLLKV